VGITAVVAMLTIGGAYAVTEVQRQQIEADAQTVGAAQLLAFELTSAIRDEEAEIGNYLLARDAQSLEEYRLAVRTEAHVTDQIRFQLSELPAVHAAVDAVSAATEVWREASAEPSIAAVGVGATDEAIAVFIRDAGQSHAALARLTEAIEGASSNVDQRLENLNVSRAAASGFGLVAIVIGAIVSAVFLRRRVVKPLDRLGVVAASVESGSDQAFVVEGDDEIGRLGAALERMRQKLRQESTRSEIFNRFTETTVFAADDTDVARANLDALELLVRPDAAVTHVLNRSKDRAMPEATLGDPIAEILPLHALSRCPGIIRGSVYVTNDAAQPLSVHCPVYPVATGTLACVPLAHGETVGAVHLYWVRPNGLPLDLRASVTRVTEHAALAIGNRRLLAALHGQANTDARTGLANSRAFDQALEDALGLRADEQSIAVLMLDLDHFKDFNDRHGHPAGDEALRAFAGILRSCLRDGDIAARYGGEEFAVALPGIDEVSALAIAERIRSRTDGSLIALSPGITDRISVSIGVAMAPFQSVERVTLLRIADEALYQAKQDGRNRVAYLGGGRDYEKASTGLAS
jgi:diguanylate cyclase (GGDEF)-like protein